MNKKHALIVGAVGGYLVYRYFNSSVDVSITDDLSSTFQTIGAWAMPADIPFPCIDPKTGQDYRQIIQTAARSTGVPALLLAALIRQESGFDCRIVNRSSGAMGLGQFMPATAAEWFGADWQTAVYVPGRAIPTTAKYLAWLYRRHGMWRPTVAAYNWGTGNVQKNGLGNMPKETRDYVRIIYDTWAASLPA